MKLILQKKNRQDSGTDFKLLKSRFLRLNQDRLRRIKSDLRPTQRDFLQLLPLFFHVNHPILPGYVSKDTPAGVPEYTADNPTLAAARRLSRSFELKKRAHRKFDIHGIYLMGSTGTIAYSDKSDFDVWLVHDSDLTHEQLVMLQDKAHEVEHWAASINVDAHIFLVDAQRFKKGENGQLGTESSGSALHYLLLEEFYRTSVLLAGRYPLWWLVPAEEEANYDNYVEDIKRKRYVHSKDHIDLGGLAKISADEFYGASLWMLYKGINSPYKSILKILLMEAYASEYPECELLCVRYKRSVYEEEKPDADKLDPYLMMLHKVEEYLQNKGEEERLDLVRRSFYFKINEQLSKESKSRSKDWRREILTEQVNKWGWHHSRLLRLDARNEWKINSVLEERKALVKEFTGTYRFLSQFSRHYPETTNHISAEDINVLGRKLYAAFERKAGKIEIVYRGITPDLYESHLSFHHLKNDEGHEYWMVFSGVIGESEISTTTPLRRAFSLTELLTWCYFNKMINTNTIFALYSHNSDLTEKELHLLTDNMCRIFPEEVLKESSIYDLRQPARIAAMGTFINVGLDPFSSHTRRGTHITSSRTDALKYGGRFENLALSIDQVVVTSWMEVLTFRYFGVDGLLHCLQDYIKWSPPSSGKRPSAINAFSFSSYRGTSIARRIESLFASILQSFYETTSMADVRYVLGIEWDYYVLYIDDDVLRYDSPGKIEHLHSYLAKPRQSFTQVMFDAETLADSVMPQVYKLNKKGLVQCFYEVKGKNVTTYILDENGSLIIQSRPFHDALGLVRHYQEFFNSIHDRMKFLGHNGSNGNGGFNEVEFFRIDAAGDGDRNIKQHSINQFFKPATFIPLQVIVSEIDGEPVFTLFCEDREFSTLEYGNSLYTAVAEHILGLRSKAEPYPIYITDIDLATGLMSDSVQKVQTAHYLHYKEIIEERLMQELSWMIL